MGTMGSTKLCQLRYSILCRKNYKVWHLLSLERLFGQHLKRWLLFSLNPHVFTTSQKTPMYFKFVQSCKLPAKLLLSSLKSGSFVGVNLNVFDLLCMHLYDSKLRPIVAPWPLGPFAGSLSTAILWVFPCSPTSLAPTQLQQLLPHVGRSHLG